VQQELIAEVQRTSIWPVVVSVDGNINMLIFHGDPLMTRVNEVINRVVEAGIYDYWISLTMERIKLHSRKKLSFSRLMDITASTSTISNLPSISS
jgi:hypothetical protein